ncbi:MAG: glycosyl hydrolase [Streptosporangiaceae bacterium]
MRPTLVVLIAIAVAVAGVVFTVRHFAAAGSGQPATVRASLPTARASYLGVYERGSPNSFQQVMTFARAADMQPNLRHGAATIVQMDPTDASVPAIAAGAYDGYLRSYADSVRDFGHPVVIGFGHEMNATWYSWGYGHVRPAMFVAAWRHLVTVFRDQGADNVTWLWTIQADVPGSGPVAAWWPGARYVTWIGIDGYYYRPTDTFASVFGRTLDQVRAIARKPVLLSETAVGPGAGQFAKIQDLFRGMARYNTLGLVWFDIAQHDGIYHQDWRIEDNAVAERSFRLGVLEDLAPVSPG